MVCLGLNICLSIIFLSLIIVLKEKIYRISMPFVIDKKSKYVSTTAMSKYAMGITRWDLLINSCVGHTTRGLWAAGVPTLYLLHPHLLNLQLLIRQLGIYSSPYLYQIPKKSKQ